MKDKVLEILKNSQEPMQAGQIAKLLDADKIEVDKAMKALAKEGAIVSPIRCKWTIA
ncbi:MAG: transcriptional regulator [Firmicutes bacterium]|nr:transcriptional regulator [Bacillota bacterium]